MKILKSNGEQPKKNINLPKNIIFKLIAIFILSNIFTFLIVSEAFIPDTKSNFIEPKKLMRPGYTDLSVEVDVRTSLETNTPYTLTNRKKTIYIPHVFYVKSLAESTDNYLDEPHEKSSLLLNVPKKYLAEIIRSGHLELYPLVERKQLITKTHHKKEMQYEINF
ncbi:MAG: hypothetical protein CME62_11440 [Halobacteriovoraceae bacterium]|nr:hypothetical protein [Halobacteriovoraceae bacterium]|tara:strand:+ start:15355 stop:15849 length:495 start_codon:yes stop_codon:yes gene_type:complete